MSKAFAWIDLETTGLDRRADRILEFAMVLTDERLRILAEPVSMALALPRDYPLSPFIRDMHTKSGLLEECYASHLDLGLAIALAEQRLDGAGLGSFEKMDERPRMAGSTISFDQGFLMAHAPGFLDKLHYRLFDVSMLKEFCRVYVPATYEGRPKPEPAHRALADLQVTMKELRHYVLFLADTALP